jgi:hypothetical protein
MSTAVHGRNPPSSVKRGRTGLCAYFRIQQSEAWERRQAWRRPRRRTDGAPIVISFERAVSGVLGRSTRYLGGSARNRRLCRGGVERDRRSICRCRDRAFCSWCLRCGSSGRAVYRVINRALKGLATVAVPSSALAVAVGLQSGLQSRLVGAAHVSSLARRGAKTCPIAGQPRYAMIATRSIT